MQYRKFGKTDMEVSEIGFGAWAIGGNATVGSTPIGWGPVDDEVSTKAIQAAVAAGINFFDTADFYGLGHSEEMLGRVLKPHKDVLIATKVGHRAAEGRITLDYSAAYIVEACENSLRRLQRDVIDYYQLHSARMPHLQDGGCIEAMQLLKQQGKIRYWGLSLPTFHPGDEASYLMDRNLGDGFQLVFNLINQRATELLRTAHGNGYGIIARMPLQFGLLTGKFSSGTRFAPDDHRSFRLTPEIIDRSLQLLEKKVWPLAEEEGLTKTQLALSFILSFEEIATVIPGIRTVDHVAQNTSGLHPLKPTTRQRLQSLCGTDWEEIVALMERQG